MRSLLKMLLIVLAPFAVGAPDPDPDDPKRRVLLTLGPHYMGARAAAVS